MIVIKKINKKQTKCFYLLTLENTSTLSINTDLTSSVKLPELVFVFSSTNLIFLRYW